MHIEESKSSSYIASLLPEYRMLQNYAERLYFWDRHKLAADLCYYACEFTDDEAGYKSKKAFGYQFWGCQTWQETLQYDFITLAPFTIIEARQFVDWALPIRRQNLPELNFEYRKREFYKSFENAPRPGKFLLMMNAGAKKWADNQISDLHAVRRNLLQLYELDEMTYAQFVQAFDLGANIDLAAYIPTKQPFFSWEVIDTYLTAESNTLYAGFLEDLNRRYDRGEIIGQTAPATAVKSSLSARQEVLLTIIQNGPAYRRDGDSYRYNLYRKFHKTSNRTGYANESWRMAKDLLEDYEAILCYLTPKQKAQAETEMFTIRAKRM